MSGSDHHRVAADIMDQACLSEHQVKNGLDAALRKDIAQAILSAERRGAERERDTVKPLTAQCYTMSEPHLSGYRLILGFDTLKGVQDAHLAIAEISRSSLASAIRKGAE